MLNAKTPEAYKKAIDDLNAAFKFQDDAMKTLDDTVKARTIDVTTSGTTVTLSGTVQSTAEHDKAIALARETAGVTHDVDNLQIAR